MLFCFSIVPRLRVFSLSQTYTKFYSHANKFLNILTISTVTCSDECNCNIFVVCFVLFDCKGFTRETMKCILYTKVRNRLHGRLPLSELKREYHLLGAGAYTMFKFCYQHVNK